MAPWWDSETGMLKSQITLTVVKAARNLSKRFTLAIDYEILFIEPILTFKAGYDSVPFTQQIVAITFLFSFFFASKLKSGKKFPRKR